MITSLHIDTLQADVAKVVQVGLSAMLGIAKPAVCNPSKGRGWHADWRNKKTAGFHASCDGLTLLLRYGECCHQKEHLNDITVDVFEHNLCTLLRGGEGQSPEVEAQRNDAYFTTMKLSKFLQVASKVDEPVRQRNKDVIDLALQTLYQEGAKGHGRWRCALDNPDADDGDRLCATVEALLALKDYLPPADPVLRSGVNFLAEYAGRQLDRAGEEEKELILTAIWAVSQLLPFVSECQLEPIRSNLMKFMTNPPTGDHNEQYSHSDHDEMFSYSLSHMGVEAFLNFREAGVVEFMHTEVLSKIVSLKDEMERKDGIAASHFYRQYHFMRALGSFLTTTRDEKGNAYMIVQPKVFTAPSTIETENIVAVLMPFSEPWSDSVFAAIEVAAQGAGVEAWRSDKDLTKQQIMQAVWENILKARYVIADCTNKNANVFYEIGIAHVLGKHVFLCAQNKDDFPFDVNHISHEEYHLENNGLVPLQKKIMDWIKSHQKKAQKANRS